MIIYIIYYFLPPTCTPPPNSLLTSYTSYVLLLILLIILDKLLLPICTWMWGHLPEHWELVSCHVFKVDWCSLSWKQEIANSSSAKGESLVSNSNSYLSLISLLLFKSCELMCTAGKSCAEVYISQFSSSFISSYVLSDHSLVFPEAWMGEISTQDYLYFVCWSIMSLCINQTFITHC